MRHNFKRLFLTCILLLSVFIITACGNKNKLVGTWKNDTTFKGYEFVYTFNSDGTGKYDAAGTVMNFTYKTDGNKISFKYTDNDMATWDTTYSVDGKTLNIKDSNNEDTLYKKVK